MTKKIVVIIFGAVTISLILYFLPLRHEINTSLKGVQCRIGDQEYTEKVTVTVKGNYFDYLFKNDTFEGDIFIDKYKDTMDGCWVDLRFYDGFAVLWYQNNKAGKPIQHHLGSILCSRDFRQILILVCEPTEGNVAKSWYGENGLFISASADNRNQAINIAKALTKRSRWLGTAEWK